MENIKISLINGGIFQTSHAYDSGYDVTIVGYARICNGEVEPTVWLQDGESVALAPNECIKIHTGVSMWIPNPTDLGTHYEIVEAQVRPRSSLSLKENTNVILGTVDNEYTGEIGVIFKNHSDDILFLSKGNKIAQIVFNRVIKHKTIDFVDNIPHKTRGANGFGSTGK